MLKKFSTLEASQAGYATRDALLSELSRIKTGQVYRIELIQLRPDPRLSLREKLPDKLTLQQLLQRLHRLDQASKSGPWVLLALNTIHKHPGVRAGDLCEAVGLEKEDFKLKVRKLKNLGLTESLDTGYRLSPRGAAVRAAPKGK